MDQPEPEPGPQPQPPPNTPPTDRATALTQQQQADAPPAPPSQEERTMALLAHLLAIPIGFLGPLIIWLVKKDESRFVDDQGKEALNFQITVMLTMVAVSVLAVITCGIGAILAFPVIVVDFVFTIMAAVRANEGRCYRYPLCIRMIQ